MVCCIIIVNEKTEALDRKVNTGDFPFSNLSHFKISAWLKMKSALKFFGFGFDCYRVGV